MRREIICAVLGLAIGTAPFAIGQESEVELRERLRSLQAAMAKVMRHQPAVEQLPPVDGRGFEFGIIPLYDLALGRLDFIRPDHRLWQEDKEWPIFGGLAEEAPQPFGTVEEILELVRGSVWPEAWENGDSLTTSNGKLYVHQRPNVVRDVNRFLDQNLRAKANRSMLVEAEVVELSPALFRELKRGKGATLTAQQRTALEQAVAARTARALFKGRITGLLGQRVLLWHGQQVSVVADTDVEVAQSAKVPDPIIGIVQDGGYLWVRPHLAGSNERVRLDVSVRLDELEQPIERRETRENGVIEMPEIKSVSAESTVRMPVRTWAMVGSATRGKDLMRVVLVRADFLARGGDR